MKEEDEKKEAFRPPGVNNWKKIVQKKCFLLLDLVEPHFYLFKYRFSSLFRAKKCAKDFVFYFVLLVDCLESLKTSCKM